MAEFFSLYPSIFCYLNPVDFFETLDLNTLVSNTSIDTCILETGKFSILQNGVKTEFMESLIYIEPKTYMQIPLIFSDWLSLSLLTGQAVLRWQDSQSPDTESSFRAFKYFCFEGKEGSISLANLTDSFCLVQIVHNRQLKFNLFESLVDVSFVHDSQIIGNLIRESSNLWRVGTSDRLINQNEFDFFISESKMGAFDRSRICCHFSNQSGLQEMFIFMKQQTTLPKMLHLDKVESFLLLEGRVMYSIYNSEGEILDQVDMVGLNNINQSRNPCFYIRIGKEVVHKPQVTSLAALAKETTTGPFRPELTTIIA